MVTFRFDPAAIAREQTKFKAGILQFAVLTAVTVAILLGGMQVRFNSSQAYAVVVLLSIGAGVFAVTAANWALDARKAANWMSRAAIAVQRQGLEVDGQVHPWDSMKVELDGGRELLVLEQANVKVPVDGLEYPMEFREQVRTASKRKVDL